VTRIFQDLDCTERKHSDTDFGDIFPLSQSKKWFHSTSISIEYRIYFKSLFFLKLDFGFENLSSHILQQ